MFPQSLLGVVPCCDWVRLGCQTVCESVKAQWESQDDCFSARWSK